MKKLMLIISIMIPAFSIGMKIQQDTQQTIILNAQTFSSLLEKYYASSDHSSQPFSHTIAIPEKGAKFELLTYGLGFFPHTVRLEIEEGTPYISIISKDSNFFAITNNRNIELAQLVKLKKAS